MQQARNIIGGNVRSLRKAIGLSIFKFSIVTGLSKASIVNIEKAKSGYNLNLLDKITSFTGYSLHDLASKDFHPNENLRERLIKTYKNNPEYLKVLNEKPEIVYAIKYKLLNNAFFKDPREIREIKAFFGKLEWTYQGTSISNALKRMPELINIQPHREKRNTFLYSRKT